MGSSREDLLDRMGRYAERSGCEPKIELGFGFDGIVFSTDRQSAIKILRYESLHQRERDVYLRLREQNVFAVVGFDVPRLLAFDDQLWVVEMSIVSPPFVLDFAGAYLDQRPDYPDEVLREWLAEKQEQFGDRWTVVRKVMAEFARHGIHLADVKPGNIEFGG